MHSPIKIVSTLEFNKEALMFMENSKQTQTMSPTHATSNLPQTTPTTFHLFLYLIPNQI